MGKKSATLGLVLLLAGATTLGLGLVEQRKEKQLLENIKLRLEKMDEVTADETDIRYLADIFSRDDWQQKLNQYNTQRQSKGLLIDTSAVFILTGSAIFVWWFLWLTARLLYRRLRRCRQTSAFEVQNQDQREHPEAKEKDKSERAVQSAKQKTGTKKKNKDNTNLEVLAGSGWFDFNKGFTDRSKTNSLYSETTLKTKPFDDLSDSNSKNVNVMLCDEKSAESKMSLKLKAERLNQHYKSSNKNKLFLDSDKDTAKLEKLIKSQRKSLEKQVAEFRQMAQSLKQASLDRSQPFGDTVKELIQQVSAIREYALGQQDRIKKLQDGYDWNIIKTFGLKVIRCIDNLKDRIERLGDNGIGITDLEEVKDELIFALESSGIEQYQPKINSDYKGQERIAETVKEKAHNKGPELKGKIAQVTRPGYRHFIDDENFKVIRAARVKLFG